MAKMAITGLEDFSSLLQSLGTMATPIAKMAMYDGAAILIEYLKQEIRAIPEEEGYMLPGRKRQVVTARDKEALITHVGIARMREQGGKVRVTIGFDGYTEYITKQYPQGVPVSLLARSIVKGTSVRGKDDFVRRAVQRAQTAVQQAMILDVQNFIADFTSKGGA